MSDHWPEENDLDQDPEHTAWVAVLYMWTAILVAVIALVTL